MEWTKEQQVRFIQTLEQTLKMYEKRLEPGMAKFWFPVSQKITFEQAMRALEDYPMSANGRYPPKPIDLIEFALGDAADPGKALDALKATYPDADAAWAMARRAADEADTLIWTDEMAFAWSMVRDMSGDAIAQRKSFQSFYRAAVDASARTGRSPEWRVSCGWDKKKRLDRVQEAVGHGYLQLESLAADDRRMLADQRQPRQKEAQRAIAGLIGFSEFTDAAGSGADNGAFVSEVKDGDDWSSRNRTENLVRLREMVEIASLEKARSAAESRRLARESAQGRRQKVIDALTEKLARTSADIYSV